MVKRLSRLVLISLIVQQASLQLATTAKLHDYGMHCWLSHLR